MSWTGILAKQEGLGDLYEGLLEKNASEQHIYRCLKRGGRAAVVLPDNDAV